MKSFLLLLAILISTNAFTQDVKKYVSNNSKYFPVRLFLLEDSRFLYREINDKNHADGIYFEIGKYQIKGDTLYFQVVGLGSNCEKMLKEFSMKTAGVSDQIPKDSFMKKALISDQSIHLLRADGNEWLELKKKNIRNRKRILDCYK